MGVGKTTLGKDLARRLGLLFLDSDTQIESEHGRTGADIAREGGVPSLHEKELAIFIEMAGSVERAVIAPAASVVDSDQGRRLLDEHFTVWIQVPAEVARERRDSSPHRRPIGTEEQQRRDEGRRRWLENLADVEVDNTRPVDVVIEELMAAVGQHLDI